MVTTPIVVPVKRSQVAKQLGITRARLAALEREGVAQPEIDSRGVPAYTAGEVDRLRTQLAHEPMPSARRRASPTNSSLGSPKSPSATSAPRIVVNSDATRDLVDRAEQLETAARVADAERRLAVLHGEEAARQRELVELRERVAEHEALSHAEHVRREWRRACIAELIAAHEAALYGAGYDGESVAYALSLAVAVLEAQPDSALVGPLFAPWLATLAISEAMRFERPSLPHVLAPILTEYGWTYGWRPVQPGD